MADRPRANGGPEKGTPEYNWLYGSQGGSTPGDDATRAVPREPRADETRVMPSGAPQGAQKGAQKARRQPAAQPAPAPAPSKPGRSGPRLPRRPRFRLRWLWTLFLLWLVFLVAIPFWAWSKVDKVDAFPANQLDDQPGTTYLMVGSDSRGDLSAEERKELGTGNASGQRTDTIMLLHTGSGPNLLMSIPRDSLVEVPGYGTTKINAAYAFGGPKLLTRTIEGATGIRVDHYVEIGFGGFVDLVDAVGGVEICPKQAMNDPQAKLNIKKGCQEADGATALGYARSRKLYTENGDIDRAKAQREVVSAIGREAASPWSVINPLRYYRLNMAAPSALAVSEGTSPLSMVQWAWAMTRVDGENGLTCGVPIADLSVRWDPERSQQMFKAIINDETDSVGKSLCTPTGFPPQ
ncbi:LCP family protein [Nocardioides sp. GCM10027113]|uniref:LCP family protein n=1 Tax=unclassified Nocardioides TaxID=2615069 RepID=UPI00360CB872